MDCIFVDASDKHDRMPINTTDVDAMKMKGTYFSSQQFTLLLGDEPVRHFTPGTDGESFSGRKRSLFNDSDSGEDT